MNADSDLFGDSRLSRIVEEHGHLDSDELRERILREIEAFVGSADQHDDMTMILIKVERDVRRRERSQCEALRASHSDHDFLDERHWNQVGRRRRTCVADLAIVNASIHTVDAARPAAEAVAICADRIARVGTNEEMRAVSDARTQIIDAGGRLLLPGFNDAHVHFIAGAEELVGVDLRPAVTEQDIAKRLAAYAATQPKGRWITGGYWDHEAWPGRPLPVTPHRQRHSRQSGVRQTP